MAVGEALAKTGEITDRQVSYVEIDRIPVPQSNPAFVAAVETTKLVLRGLRIEATGGRENGMAFVFDMNELFERYFASLLTRYKTRLGLAEVLIQKRRALVERIYDVAAKQVVGGTMVTFTDLLVKTKSGRSIVIDTKYKLAAGEQQFHAGVSNADAYQILAYQGLYSDSTGVPDGVLVYPESYRPAFFRFELRSGRCFYLKTIPLSEDLACEETSLVDELLRFFIGLEDSHPPMKQAG
jgi:5-methylcytosine-specific restriction endonuclease McrBC regulatory subunit McrC